jgi:hypothetical protein
MFVLGITNATNSPWRLIQPTREGMAYAMDKLNHDATKYGYEKDPHLIQILIIPKQLVYLAERSTGGGKSDIYSERHYVFELQPSALGKAKAICIMTRVVSCASWIGDQNKPKSSFFYKLSDSIEGAMAECSLPLGSRFGTLRS